MTVCFDRSEQRSYQDAIDTRDMRDEVIARRTEELHEELYGEMLMGISGEHAVIKSVFVGPYGEKHEILSSPVDAIYSVLDSDAVAPLLLFALVESTCHLVWELKSAMNLTNYSRRASVMAALDLSTNAEQFLHALKLSTCHIIRQLRIDIAAQYAADNANDLAMLEAGN